MGKHDSNKVSSITQSHIEGEEWRPVVGYEDVYEASNLGRVRRAAPGNHTRVGKVLKPGTKPSGYRFVNLCVNGVTKNINLHKVIAEAFLGKRPDGAEINHIDANKSNNSISNLEYVTPQENMRHSSAMWRHPRQLSVESIVRIHELLAAEAPHLTYGKIAEIIGVHKQTVARIARGRHLGALSKGFETTITNRRLIRLSEKDLEEIKQHLTDGKLNQRQIAAMYGVHEATISRIKTTRATANDAASQPASGDDESGVAE